MSDTRSACWVNKMRSDVRTSCWMMLSVYQLHTRALRRKIYRHEFRNSVQRTLLLPILLPRRDCASTEMKPDFQLIIEQVRRNMSKLPDCGANGLFTSENVETSRCRAKCFPKSAHFLRSPSSGSSMLEALAITADAVQAWMRRLSSENIFPIHAQR